MTFLERLQSGEIIIADGAMGTMLAQHSVDLTGCVEQVNLDKPEILQDIARRYFEAGAEIIQTATFGASPLKLSMYSMEHQTDQIISNAVEAVKSAVGDKAIISGSVGPSGRLLKPYGDVEPEIMQESFKHQISCLIDNGVNILCIETMIDLAEASLAIEAAREISPTIPIMAAMTFDPTPRGYFTVMGVNIEQAIEGLKSAGADIIGSNCGNGFEKMIEIASEFKCKSDLPIIIQSNAGLPKIIDGQPVYRETPEFMAECALKLKEIGVSVIGGCCGTTPEHIRAIKQSVQA